MYIVTQYKQNERTLTINDSYIGETIEEKVRRVTRQNEPIEDGAERIYTERKDGVLPEYNIRTDRFELAVDAMDTIAKSKLASREERIKAREAKVVPLHGTEGDKNAASNS